MSTEPVTLSGLRQAIEGRDAAALVSFYLPDAVLQIIDQDNPPSRPMQMQGREAIAAWLEDVCSRAMTHRVEAGAAEGDRLAFTQSCSYPDGMRVACSAMLELKGGRIARQVVLQVWDA